MRIVLRDLSKDELRRQDWSYWVNADHGNTIRIVLDGYVDMERPTKRHKFNSEKATRVYSRLSYRRTGNMDVDSVPLPIDEKSRIEREIVRRIEVLKEL